MYVQIPRLPYLFTLNLQGLVEKKEMKGIQLFGSDNAQFFTSYLLKGIPRFILLDRDGKIIDSNALRPSDKELKKQLLENL